MRTSGGIVSVVLTYFGAASEQVVIDSQALMRSDDESGASLERFWGSRPISTLVTRPRSPCYAEPNFAMPSAVFHERLSTPSAEMPGPTHEYKILCAFSQKRAIELQVAVLRSEAIRFEYFTFERGWVYFTHACFPFSSAQGLSSSPPPSCAGTMGGGWRSSGASVRGIRLFRLLAMGEGRDIVDGFGWVTPVEGVTCIFIRCYLF